MRVVREHVAAIQAHDLDRLSETTDESFVLQSDALPRFGFPSGRTDRQGYLNLWRHLWASIPEARYDIERGDLFGRGDTVVCCWWGYGTHVGEWAGAASTGRQLDSHGCSVFKVRNGKIVADFDYFDTGKILEQTGQLQQGAARRPVNGISPAGPAAAADNLRAGSVPAVARRPASGFSPAGPAAGRAGAADPSLRLGRLTGDGMPGSRREADLTSATARPSILCPAHCGGARQCAFMLRKAGCL